MDLTAIAQLLSQITGLSLEDNLTLCNAPIKLNSVSDRDSFLSFASRYAAGLQVRVRMSMSECA
jgi:hypothetical protein